jgi:outer membrane protein assembly factor BamB
MEARSSRISMTLLQWSRRERRRALHLARFLALAFCACVDPRTGPLSVNSGRIIWRAEGVGHGIPAFDETTVYFLGWNHDVTAVDKETGVVRWKEFTAGDDAVTDGYDVVLAGTVVAIADIDIYAFDRQTGARRWTFRPSDDYAGYVGLSTDGSLIFGGSTKNRAYAVDPSTGAERWRTDVTSDSAAWISYPVAAGGLVFYCVTHLTQPYTGAVVALDASTGVVRWLRDFAPPSPSHAAGCFKRPTVSQALVIASTDDGRLYALDRETGDSVWMIPALTFEGGVEHGPIAAIDDVLIAAGNSGVVRAYDIQTGTQRWQSSADQGSITWPIALDADRVFVVHAGAQLAAFDRDSGNLLWVEGAGVTGGGEYNYTPSINGQHLYVGGKHGLYALKKE